MLAPRLVDGTLVAYVTESCVGCQQLLASLEHGKSRRDEPLVLVAKNASPGFREALGATGLPAVFDQGAIWRACGVSATPLVIRLDQEGRVVAKEVTHLVDRVAVVDA
jgi:hypothetical protein